MGPDSSVLGLHYREVRSTSILLILADGVKASSRLACVGLD